MSRFLYVRVCVCVCVCVCSQVLVIPPLPSSFPRPLLLTTLPPSITQSEDGLTLSKISAFLVFSASPFPLFPSQPKPRATAFLSLIHLLSHAFAQPHQRKGKSSIKATTRTTTKKGGKKDQMEGKIHIEEEEEKTIGFDLIQKKILKRSSSLPPSLPPFLPSCYCNCSFKSPLSFFSFFILIASVFVRAHPMMPFSLSLCGSLPSTFPSYWQCSSSSSGP